MRQKWEYLMVISLISSDEGKGWIYYTKSGMEFEGVDEMLTRLGKDCWELVCTAPFVGMEYQRGSLETMTNQEYFYFKRPLAEESTMIE